MDVLVFATFNFATFNTCYTNKIYLFVYLFHLSRKTYFICRKVKQKQVSLSSQFGNTFFILNDNHIYGLNLLKQKQVKFKRLVKLLLCIIHYFWVETDTSFTINSNNKLNKTLFFALPLYLHYCSNNKIYKFSSGKKIRCAPSTDDIMNCVLVSAATCQQIASDRRAICCYFLQTVSSLSTNRCQPPVSYIFVFSVLSFTVLFGFVDCDTFPETI